MRIDVEEYKAAINDLYPTLSGKQVKKAANQMAAAQTPPSAWNITETIQSGRAPSDGFMRCRKARRSDPFSDMHVADPTGNRGVRNACEARRLGVA
jgi:hypothetical protein